MSILLGLLTLSSALLTLAVSATAFQLRASDAAGNGLAQAFLAVGVIALWGTLAILLLLVAFRQQRFDLPWGSINTWAIVLFVLACAGQLACLAQLAGKQSDGWFRVALQLAVIVPPIAVLLHNASDLTSMNTNYVINRRSDPLVVDSYFRIYELRDLQLVKSSLGLLVRGQGVEPVKFRLIPSMK